LRRSVGTIPQIPHIHENKPDETKLQRKGLSRVDYLPIHKSGRIGRHHGLFMCKPALLLLRLVPLGCAETLGLGLGPGLSGGWVCRGSKSGRFRNHRELQKDQFLGAAAIAMIMI
jgi:hypothetical protein